MSRTHRKQKPKGFCFCFIYILPAPPGSGFFASKAAAPITSPVRTAKELQEIGALFVCIHKIPHTHTTFFRLKS